MKLMLLLFLNRRDAQREYSAKTPYGGKIRHYHWGEEKWERFPRDPPCAGWRPEQSKQELEEGISGF